MASMLLRCVRKTPRPHTCAKALSIDPSELVAEETSPLYDPKTFYPASIGETLNDRYQIATKLGHGASSTVWLARDLNQ